MVKNMLEKTTKMVIEGKCKVEGNDIKGFRAIIEFDDDYKMIMHPYVIDAEGCKTFRKEVRKAEAEFEDYAYQVQEELMATK